MQSALAWLRLQTLVAAIRQQTPGLDIIAQVQAENIAHNDLSEVWNCHGKQQFDPTVEVAWHEIRTAEKDLLVSAIAKIIDPGMLQEASNYGRHRDGLAHPRNTWA